MSLEEAQELFISVQGTYMCICVCIIMYICINFQGINMYILIDKCMYIYEGEE